MITINDFTHIVAGVGVGVVLGIYVGYKLNDFYLRPIAKYYQKRYNELVRRKGS